MRLKGRLQGLGRCVGEFFLALLCGSSCLRVFMSERLVHEEVQKYHQSHPLIVVGVDVRGGG